MSASFPDEESDRQEQIQWISLIIFEEHPVVPIRERSRSKELEAPKKRGRPPIYRSSQERYNRKLERDRLNQKNYRQRKNKKIQKIEEQNQHLKSCLVAANHSSAQEILEAKGHVAEELKKIRHLVTSQADQTQILARLDALEALLTTHKLFTFSEDIQEHHRSFLEQLVPLPVYIMQSLTAPQFLTHLDELTWNPSPPELPPLVDPPRPGRPVKNLNEQAKFSIERLRVRLCANNIQASQLAAFLRHRVLPLGEVFDRTLRNFNKMTGDLHELAKKYNEYYEELKRGILLPQQHLLLLEHLVDIERQRPELLPGKPAAEKPALPPPPMIEQSATVKVEEDPFEGFF